MKEAITYGLIYDQESWWGKIHENNKFTFELKEKILPAYCYNLKLIYEYIKKYN